MTVSPASGSPLPGPPPCPDGPDLEFTKLLADLTAGGGLDFASYRRPGLLRRVARRMTALGLADYSAYRARLRTDPDEYRALCDAVPVHRTSFFRDPATWAHLAAEVFPRVARAAGPRAAARAWCAGCATGEEAYTLAMLLAEAAGPAALARRRVVVFATDVSGAAVATARAGRYRADAAVGIPARLRDRYLRPDGANWVVGPDLRRAVAFARHDLLRDRPLRRMDLIVCRNTLMYFTAAAQERVMAGFARGLDPGGTLVVGRVEAPHVWSDRFRVVSLPHRVYRPVGPAPAPRRPNPLTLTRP